VFRSSYVAAGYESEYEDLWVESMLTTAVGDDSHPGDSVESASWPGRAPGEHGVLNTMVPNHLDLTGIVQLERQDMVVDVLVAHIDKATFRDAN
jgi:hypothetical protein